ncbi:MAG: hypothetical protein KDD70_06110 [Bdellovibrionales bacterium]|nr:hypothetical protein [Bdellovibrionales bacterium]
MKSSVRKELGRNESGAAIPEYLTTLVGGVLASVLAAALLGQGVSDTFTEVQLAQAGGTQTAMSSSGGNCEFTICPPPAGPSNPFGINPSDPSTWPSSWPPGVEPGDPSTFPWPGFDPYDPDTWVPPDPNQARWPIGG